MSSLSVVLASPVHQEVNLMDLQRREVLDRAIRPPFVPFGDDHPNLPKNADDKQTKKGDGSDLYRSKKENPDDPPTDAPADYLLKRSERATEYNHDPKDEGKPEIVDPKKATIVAKGRALRDITVQIAVKGKMKWLRTKAAWPVDPHRYSYYRSFNKDKNLVTLKLAQGDDAEVDTKDLKMEVDHNLEHQELLKFVFSDKAPVPNGVDKKLWRKWADQYSDAHENTPLKVALAQVLNHPDNSNNLDGVINQLKGDLTTSVMNKLLTGTPAGGPKYAETRSRSALWATAKFLKLERTQTMYKAYAKEFAETFEKHTKEENKEAAKKCKDHIVKRLVTILRPAVIKRAFDDLKAKEPDNWDPKKKTTYKKAMKDEDVPNEEQWDGTDGSELEGKMKDEGKKDEDKKDGENKDGEKKDEKKEECKSGFYKNGEDCAQACKGGKCRKGAGGLYVNSLSTTCTC